ncbi:MAG TPA: polyprenyl synthetase family protein [Thermomicrobiaceae bacterium]|nr:polyprenyl synthetase family protein [Thermomicrobiaceae bacterium]
MGADLRRVEDRLRDETRVNYPFIGEILTELIAAGGKRLRPLLLLLAARPFDYELEQLLPAAAGVELLHTASLIHDDTIDHAELRRGRPTLNSRISTETVILFGDYIFARAAMLAAATMNPRVVGVFASTLGEICDGQLQEIFTTRQLEQSRDDYLRRIFGKTAALFAGSAEMGAILGQAAPDAVDALRRFGGDVGMAFQIIDDVLDLRENTAHLGKPSGLDLRQGTITLPTMMFVEQADGDGRELARRVIDGRASDREHEELVRAIRASDALSDALRVAECYVAGAHAALEPIPDGESRRMLAALADHSLRRTH